MTKENYSFKMVFASACMGMLLFGIGLISLGSVLPSLIAKFDLNEIQAGALASLLPIGLLGGSLVFGPIVDRYSYRNFLIFFTILLFAGIEGVALASNFRMLQIFFFIIGFGGGALNGATNALVTDISASNSKRSSANLSLLGVFFGIGALGMPLVMGVLSEKFQYEYILVAIGIFMVLPVLYFLFIKFPKPKQSQSYPLNKSIGLIKESTLLLLGIFLFFQSGLEGVISNWTTTYLQNEISSIESEALYSLTIYMLSLTISRLILSSLLNRTRPYIILIASVILLICGALIMMAYPTQWGAYLSLALFGIGAAAGFPVILGYVGDIYSELSGTAFSFVFVIAISGNIFFNYLMGVVSHSFGMDKFLLILLGCAICLLILLAVVFRRVSKKTKKG